MFDTCRRTAGLLLTALAVASCSRDDGSARGLSRAATSSASAAPTPGPAAPPPHALTPAAQLGRLLFFDKRLSASGNMSCATCHDPARAYGPPNDLAVQLGGPRGTSPGLRATPSLRYKEFTPGYADLLDNPDGFSQPGPGGGFAWDGRADSLAEQARAPLLSPFEMANADPAEVIFRLRASSSAAAFVQLFGAAALDSVDVAFGKLSVALQSFQIEDPSFHPYNSRYDLYLYKKPGGELTAAELRGLRVFKDKETGNCNGCHLADASLDDGAPAQLTDFSFEAIGVPRNAQIPANRDHRHRDLGICGPLRDDHARFPEYCGLFKTPTLRNVGARGSFFHNGVIHSLEQAVRFYNTRDTRPELWYPTVGGRAKLKPDANFPSYGLVTAEYVGGTVQKFDDLSATDRKNLDTQLPLDGRAAGSKAPMTEQQVTDLLCFLQALTDGDLSGAAHAQAQCLD